MARTWFDRLLASIADRGRAWIKIPSGIPPLDQVRQLAQSLLSEKGEASGAALAQALIERFRDLGAADRLEFYRFVADRFAPDETRLRAAAEQYLREPTPAQAANLVEVAEPPRRELLRRINMGSDGTATLVAMRQELLGLLRANPALEPLETDLKHLLISWFNRGFLEIRRIDWNTPASILEKLIQYEAVHEIEGWDDLRRRLASDRRCFAFFHPALTDEPLIFVEVALMNGMAGAIKPLLARGEGAQPDAPDTAIFYSISNCQKGLRGISFGNFLIKQVVDELKLEVPSLNRFATLSPVPGFRPWLDALIAKGASFLLRPDERDPILEAAGTGTGGAKGAFKRLLATDGWPADPKRAAALKAPLSRLCARYLTETNGKGPGDPVARFHLGNGARLERINWLANTSARGLRESHGLMVNYLYDLDRIEANHEAFVRQGEVARSDAVAELLREDRGAVKGVTSLLSFASGRRSG